MTANNDPSFLEAWREVYAEFRRSFRRNRLKALAEAIGFLGFLAIVFFIGFFIFGGWLLFDDYIPDWVGRLLIFLVVVLVAWSFSKPVFDRWKRDDERAP